MKRGPSTQWNSAITRHEILTHATAEMSTRNTFYAGKAPPKGHILWDSAVWSVQRRWVHTKKAGALAGREADGLLHGGGSPAWGGRRSGIGPWRWAWHWERAKCHWTGHFGVVDLVNFVIYTVSQFFKKAGVKRRPRGCGVLDTWPGAHSPPLQAAPSPAVPQSSSFLLSQRAVLPPGWPCLFLLRALIGFWIFNV